MLVKRDAAVPEVRALFRPDEDAVEQLAGEDRADRQQTDRHQYRPRAFMRMISAGSGRRHAAVMGAVTVLMIGRVVVAMERVLDVFGRGPARLPKEGQEDQPPRIETRQQRRERTQEKGDA